MAPGQRGFTLIELMVVLLIMGLFAGLVSTITRPDDRALLRVEAERLAQLLDLAATKSRLTGKSIAWTADGPGYRFWQYNEDTYWSEIVDDDSMRPRTLPQGMMIAAMRVENTRMPQQMRQPAGVVAIRLMSSQILDMLRVGQQNLHLTVIQNVVDGPPVRSRALHHGMRTVVFPQPLMHPLQVFV